ncbi:uncharacterized protein EV420DRAFT_155112 [Desarmillaria tabescens]|uniref:MYND-type domain-containing protein n=1 Tax=Armillaria tabescens TaxID=1929756 RepID=A0AA39J9L1_ARMTA|nr:uncharacterized protein EV420DRAFT_155112 [Desarmillaria tabescens]KAK0437922.1 hypothetical protein EV420DRAFT_155112 [Desarmillaria tabescens]
MCLADTHSSVTALLPSISFWLCFFCEHIILPSRTPEFKLIDFHHAVVFMLAWAADQNEIILEPKLFTDYLPFLWFHPPAGYTKYNRDDAQSVFVAVYNAVLRCESTALREALVGRLEENSMLTARLIIQFIMDEFAYIPEESDMRHPYQTLWIATVFSLELSGLSLSIHTALLKNNSMQWMSLILRFVTRRVRFTHTTLLMATDCASRCLPYILRVMQDGHSYIHRLLGYDVLLYMFKAFHNLHAHPNLIDQELKELQTSMENDAVEILFMVASHCYYASILKRSKKATFKIQRRHLDDFVDSSSEPVSRIWTWLVDIVLNRPDISKSLDSLCGSKQCPRTSVGEFMTCSGCQFTLYCSRTCQKDDWSSGDHRSLCKKIKQLRIG